MLDAITLDQVRTFLAAVDEGSFSAAGRKLRRAQSAVSQTLANLEAQLGIRLFERSGRYPRLTDEGRSLLRDARSIADCVDGFKASAHAMRSGLEPELAVSVDVMFPMEPLTRAAAHSQSVYPRTPLRLAAEVLGAVIEPVLDGRCNIGILGSLPFVPDELRAEPLLHVPFVTVAAPTHAFAGRRGTVPASAVAEEVQLVLTDRSPLTKDRDFFVISDTAWRLADLGAKLAFLRAGLGWGAMPTHMVKDDLELGALVRIRVEGFPRNPVMPMRAIYRRDTPPGPAARAFLSQLVDSPRRSPRRTSGVK